MGPLIIHSRGACDIAPIELSIARGDEKDRLLSYVWPDHYERVERLRAAIAYVELNKPKIDTAEASKWLETQWLKMQSQVKSKMRPRVFYHSIIWQYFNPQQQNEFTNTMQMMGCQATDSSPLIWLRLEPHKTEKYAELLMTVWPNRSEHFLAKSGFHGEWLRWYGLS